MSIEHRPRGLDFTDEEELIDDGEEVSRMPPFGLPFKSASHVISFAGAAKDKDQKVVLYVSNFLVEYENYGVKRNEGLVAAEIEERAMDDVKAKFPEVDGYTEHQIVTNYAAVEVS